MPNGSLPEICINHKYFNISKLKIYLPIKCPGGSQMKTFERHYMILTFCGSREEDPRKKIQASYF